LVSVGCYANSGVTGLFPHGPSKFEVMLTVCCNVARAQQMA
jgi:hypothetical protein